jgi:N6-adenosine-specific RNA methylase IME4
MIELPTIEGGFRCLLADPPWKFSCRTALQTENWDSRRDVDKHYSTMSLEDIKAMPVKQIAAKDAHLFLWVTGPCLPWGFEVLTAWGFKYSTLAFVWTKLKRSHKADQLRLVPSIDSDFHCGLGLTTRKNVELVLLGRRGNARREAKDVRELILAPRREHSRKPDEVYERIERYCVGPRLELFGRQSRPGWTTFGNEATKFDEAA